MKDLAIRVLQGRATREEQEELRRYREMSAENERLYQELARLWSVTGAGALDVEAGDVPEIGGLIDRAEAENRVIESRPRDTREHEVAAQPAHAFAKRSRAHVPSKGSSAHEGKRRWVRQAVAGLVAASLVAVGFGLAMLSMGQDTPGLLATSEIATGAGEMTTLTLGDGSSVRIGARSQLRLIREEDRVVADLNGRAFFGVRSDPSRRFTVRTEHGEAEVLGTRFEVRSEDGEFRVLVVEGSVEVASGGETIGLLEGQMSQSIGGGPPTSSAVDEVYPHLDWMGNALVFQATPLSRVTREIERRYGVQVFLEEPELADVSITATFTDKKLEEVILVICEIVGARCLLEEDRIRISAGGSAIQVRDRAG